MKSHRTPPACPRCGRTFGEFGLEGLCGTCLLGTGLEKNAPGTTEPLGSGPRRFGDYELIEEIARGGMGVVFRARQTSLNRIVAVKLILRGEFASAAELVRFRAEAETAAHLQHQNIVAIHEVGECEGQPFFSMDYVDGQNLAQVVGQTFLPPARAARYLQTIAEAVQYAHERGVLHRDLKPSNVLIDTHDQPRVTDFGLAKRLHNAEPGTRNPELTLTGQLLGSPNFMPPEQAAGRSAGLGPAGDVYALGAILYHMLTGRPPFVADSLTATLRLVAESEPISPRLLTPGVPPDLETICLKCLRKEPSRRYATARELADELGRFLRDEPIHARPAGRGEKFWRWCRRHPALASVSALAALLLVAATVAAVRLQRANEAGQEKLWQSYLAQARATRWSGREGRRFDALESIKKAVAIRPSLELRNEAIAAMALVDLRSLKTWDLPPDGHQTFDPQYEHYARAESNGTVILRRVKDDGEVARWPNFGLSVNLFGFSPNGTLFAIHYRSVTNAHAFKLYDLRHPGTVRLNLPGLWIRNFDFSPSHPILAISSSSESAGMKITFYHTETGRELASFPTSDLPYGMQFSPDGTKLAVSSEDSVRVHLYSVPDGVRHETLVHSNGVSGLSWSPDGHRLAAGCADRNYYVWNLGADSPTATLLPLEGVARACYFSQRGDLLLTCGWDHLARLWDLPTAREMMRFTADGVAPFGKEGQRFSMRPTPHSVSLCEFASGEECRRYRFNTKSGATYKTAISPDGCWMASTHLDGIRFWNLATGTQLAHAVAEDVIGIQFAPGGHGLVTSGRDAVRFWPIQSQEAIGRTRIEVGSPRLLSREEPVSVNPSNRMLSITPTKAYVFDARSLRIERRFALFGPYVNAAISPDGLLCATYANKAREIEVWDVNSGRRATNFTAPFLTGLGFTPDGRWFAIANEEGYVFFESSKWIRRHTIPRGETGGAHGRYTFTPDGSMGAMALDRASVGLYDMRTFSLLATLEPAEPYAVSGLEFSPDGTQLMVSSTMRTIYRWDLRLIRRQLVGLGLDILLGHSTSSPGRLAD